MDCWRRPRRDGRRARRPCPGRAVPARCRTRLDQGCVSSLVFLPRLAHSLTGILLGACRRCGRVRGGDELCRAPAAQGSREVRGVVDVLGLNRLAGSSGMIRERACAQSCRVCRARCEGCARAVSSWPAPPGAAGRIACHLSPPTSPALASQPLPHARILPFAVASDCTF